MNFLPDDDSVFCGTDEKCCWLLDMIIYGVGKCFHTVPTISTENLEILLGEQHPVHQNDTVLMVDVREKEEYNVSHLKNATWIDFSEPMKWQSDRLLSLMEEKVNLQNDDKKLKVIAYCAVGFRASWLLWYTERRLQRRRKEAELGTNAGSSVRQTLLLKTEIDFCNVEGSIFKWAHEERPMVDMDDRVTTLVHGNALLWGKCLVDKNYLYPGPYRAII